MATELDRIVIVGGGIGGVSTASALRAGGYEGELTLIDAGEFPYDRPPLSKGYLSGSQDLKQIALQSPQWFDEQHIRLLSLTTAAAVRVSEGKVELADGATVSADRVVLATGGKPARPPIPGTTSNRIHVLRTSDDADALRAAFAPDARVLVVGAGLIGAEVASTALDLGCDVVLVDPVPLPLAGAVGDDIAAWLHELHGERGITTLRAGVESFTDTGSGVDAQISGETETRSFDVVVMGVGMAPETTLAEAAGLETDRGVVVDERQVSSNSSVLAVGDPARVRRDGVLMPRAEHWDAARLDGQRAAASILGVAGPTASTSWFWTDRHHRHVECVGHIGSAEKTVLRGTVGGTAFSAFAFRDGLVIGAVAVDDSKAARAARRMIDRALTVDPIALADPATDLRQLLRSTAPNRAERTEIQ